MNQNITNAVGHITGNIGKVVLCAVLLILLFPVSVFASEKVTWTDDEAEYIAYKDEKGDIIFDKDLEYAILKRVRDESGRVVEEYYFDADMNPVENNHGVHGVLKIYEDDGTVWESYVNCKGEPDKTTHGYYFSRNEYNGAGQVEYVWYYGKDGKPVDIGRGQYGSHGIREEGKETLWVPCDKNGNDLILPDKILAGSPIVIILLAAAGVILAVVMKGRWRYLLLAAAVAAILYFTLLTRNSTAAQEPRLQLFYAYREALKSTEAARQILYNILLFVPFGAVLMRLMVGKGSCPMWKGFLCCILVCLAFSVAIEVIQLVFNLGTFELDDMLNNTIGGAIGAGCVGLICAKVLKGHSA